MRAVSGNSITLSLRAQAKVVTGHHQEKESLGPSCEFKGQFMSFLKFHNIKLF